MENAIQAFLAYIQNERRYSDHTVQAYQRDLAEFQEFIRTSGASPLPQLAYRDMRLYLAYLNERQLSPTTISRKLSSLRSFFKYCYRQGWIDQDPTSLIQYKVKKHRLPDFLYEQEVQALLQAAKKDKRDNHLRNRAIVELLYATGMRVSECANLKRHQVDLDLLIIRVVGKGNKERIVPFGQPAKNALQVYLKEEYPALLASYKGQEAVRDLPLFLSDKHQPISPDQIRKVLNQLVQDHGLNFKIHPHQLRHSFATHLLNHGADMRSVQELLGHDHLSSTQIYTHITNDHMRQEYLQAHPRARRQNKEEDV